MLAILGLRRNGAMEEEEVDDDEEGALEEEAKLLDDEEPWVELKAPEGNMLCKSVRK